MRTALAEHPNPIYTQPVDAYGNSATGDRVFDSISASGRQLLANGLPLKDFVGKAYAQRLQMKEPHLNVVVGSPREPYAKEGANTFVEQGLLNENKVSALPFRCS